MVIKNIGIINARADSDRCCPTNSPDTTLESKESISYIIFKVPEKLINVWGVKTEGPRIKLCIFLRMNRVCMAPITKIIKPVVGP